MSVPAIRVTGLGKRYQLGARQTSYGSLRESLTELLRSPWRRFRSLAGQETAAESFWALRDVNFEIAPGEVVGIIGRNGAGKSTLLKVLSRITDPTTGRLEIAGRVASLLEVGTGFHPELTGRENIHLNGAILGMRRSEIRGRFEQIVEFSEVGPFLDTPVKRYSSGMYMRLAFAVAAHLDPEILIVDEVLAVGDATFQKKCLGRMGEVARGGRTVLFVSHNMHSVTRLCTRGILMSQGTVAASGPIHGIVQQYLSDGTHCPAQRSWTPGNAPGDAIARLCSARVFQKEGQTAPTADIREPIGVEMTYDVLQSGRVLVPNFHFHNSDGVCAFVLLGWQHSQAPLVAGRYRSVAWIPGNTLAEGTLSVGLSLTTLSPVTAHFWAPDSLAFEVVDTLDGGSARGPYGGDFPGVVRPVCEWQTQRIAPEGSSTIDPSHPGLIHHSAAA